MIGQQGWVVRFEVSGSTRAECEKRIVACLTAFDPEGSTDSGQGWRMDVDVRPLIRSGSGEITEWEADVVAQRVTIRPEPDDKGEQHE